MVFDNLIPVFGMDKLRERRILQFFSRDIKNLSGLGIWEFNDTVLSNEDSVTGVFYY